MSSSVSLPVRVFSWLSVLWIARVFLTSIPYKFTQSPDTQHIFGTIGTWLGGFFGEGLGNAFAQFGPYVIGSAEILASAILLLPGLLWIGSKLNLCRALDASPFHALGGLFASAIMAGAVFFHLFSPLGIEVLHNGEGDGGSLFYAAASILVLGVVLFFINGRRLRNPFSA
ncbi:MAG: hypothetical protein AAF460_04035 [Pseudomonadota bacterium]